MDHNGSYGTSWADQWDYGQDPAPAARGGGAKSKKNDVLEKTKAAATTGLKKVKQGTTHGLQWVKEKYHSHKRNQKH